MNESKFVNKTNVPHVYSFLILGSIKRIRNFGQSYNSLRNLT